MKPGRLTFGLISFLVLGASGLSQEVAVSFTAGGFFSVEEAYRQMYGSSIPLAAEIWLKAKGPFGLTAGYNSIGDDGLAVPVGAGEAEYPVEFRRTTIPVVAFYQFDLRSVRIRAGAGIGIHRYDEVWQTYAVDFEGHRVSPRFQVTATSHLFGGLSLIGTLVYDTIPTGAGSLLESRVNLGGFQILGGLSYRIF